MIPSPIQQLAERLRAARTRLGVTQGDFAAKCGLDRLYYGRIELGKQNPTYLVLVRIALELEMDLGDLLSDLSIDPETLRALPKVSRGPRKK